MPFLRPRLKFKKKNHIKIDDKTIVNKIDHKLYGCLLEHIYHSVSNGVWGEEVWNRSFEETSASGKWTVDSKGIVAMDASDGTASFNIGKGKDFELSLDVCPLSQGDISFGVRDQSRDGMPTNSVVWTPGKQLAVSTGWIWYSPTATTTVENMPDGKTRKNKWTRIEIVCNGDTITGMENGNVVFKKKIDNCPADGFITIGGKGAKALFRNIAIKNIGGDGHVSLNPIRHWRLTGDGSISARHDSPLNDSTYALVETAGKLAGVEQPDKQVVVCGNPLVGSVWLKGSVKSAVVSLTDNGKILSTQRIDGIGKEWKEFPVTLSATGGGGETISCHASLQICTEEKGGLCVDQVSLMHKSSVEDGGFRPMLAKAVAQLHPAILRWPGGSFSEQYHFENGIGRQEQRKGKLRWDDFDPLSFGTDEFIAFCRKTGAEPQIVVSIGYHNYRGYDPGTDDWLKRATDWMDYCNGDSTTYWGRQRIENGHAEPYNVKYWEIDNEAWKMNPHKYVEILKKFSTAMRHRYPGVKIIACGCGRLGKEGAGLDSIVINDAAGFADYISPHYYQTINKFGNDGVEEYGRYIDKLVKWIASSRNPKMRVYVSEWNLDGTDVRTGLFAGGFLNRLERTPGVAMAAPALLLRHTSATGWNNAFINFDQCGWFPAPNYVVFKLWRDHFLPNRIAVTDDSGDLNIIATATDDKSVECVKIVNASAETANLSIEIGRKYADASYETVYAPTLTTANSMSQPGNVRVRKGRMETKGSGMTLQVEPYSASVLTVKF